MLSIIINEETKTWEEMANVLEHVARKLRKKELDMSYLITGREEPAHIEGQFEEYGGRL